MGREGEKGKKRVESREAILDFQYAEKMKSGLIIGVNLLGQLASLNEEELCGGRKVLVWYMEGLLRETQVAGNVFGTANFLRLEQKITEVIEEIEMSQFEEAQRSFSEAISLATTLCQTSMSFLVEKKLI